MNAFLATFLGTLLGSRRPRLLRTFGGLAFLVVVLVVLMPEWLRWLLGGLLLALLVSKVWPRAKSEIVAGHTPDAGGSVYVIRAGGRVYHGSSGDFLRLLERMREHYEEGRIPLDRSGVRIEVDMVPTRDAAFDLESVRIDQSLSDGVPVWNRRREGRRTA